MINQRAIYILLGALLLLLIGAGIYYFFRSPIIAFTLFNIAPDKYIASNTNNPFIYFMVFCLPDALWYMSLLLIQTFFLKEKGWSNRVLVGIAISLPFLLEIGQNFGVIPGIFDWFDIITYCITLILFLCLRKTSLFSPCK
jgi:hypothetical protein